MTINELLKAKGMRVEEVVENITEFNKVDFCDMDENTVAEFSEGNYDFDDDETYREYEGSHISFDIYKGQDLLEEGLDYDGVREFLLELVRENSKQKPCRPNLFETCDLNKVVEIYKLYDPESVACYLLKRKYGQEDYMLLLDPVSNAVSWYSSSDMDELAQDFGMYRLDDDDIPNSENLKPYLYRNNLVELADYHNLKLVEDSWSDNTIYVILEDDMPVTVESIDLNIEYGEMLKKEVFDQFQNMSLDN